MLIGHDAELAILDKEGNGVPAHHFFPSKDTPLFTGYSVDENWHRDCIFRDGTSLEINTPGAIYCIAHTLESTRRSMHRAGTLIPEGYTLHAVSAYKIKEILAKAPADVLNSGCSPVKNAYEGWEDRAIYMSPRKKWRFAGGHIHMMPEGWVSQLAEDKQRDFCPFAVKRMDLEAAIPMIYMGIEGKNGQKRRKVYGKAGEYRFQTYKVPAEYCRTPKANTHGIEYRVLGPEWLRDRGLTAIAFRLVRQSLQSSLYWFARQDRKEPDKVLEQEAREAINVGKVDEIVKSETYQKYMWPNSYTNWPVTKVQLDFIKGHKKLFEKTTVQNFKGNMHDNVPECWHRWGFRG